MSFFYLTHGTYACLDRTFRYVLPLLNLITIKITCSWIFLTWIATVHSGNCLFMTYSWRICHPIWRAKFFIGQHTVLKSPWSFGGQWELEWHDRSRDFDHLVESLSHLITDPTKRKMILLKQYKELYFHSLHHLIILSSSWY